MNKILVKNFYPGLTEKVTDGLAVSNLIFRIESNCFSLMWGFSFTGREEESCPPTETSEPQNTEKTVKQVPIATVPPTIVEKKTTENSREERQTETIQEKPKLSRFQEYKAKLFGAEKVTTSEPGSLSLRNLWSLFSILTNILISLQQNQSSRSSLTNMHRLLGNWFI